MTQASKHRFRRYTDWAKLVSGVGLAQVMVQGLTMLTGLMVVRFLRPSDYAYYTLAAGVLGFLSVIMDSGMSAGSYTVGGQIWKDPKALGDLVFTLKLLRNKFMVLGAIFSIPLLGLLLLKNGAPWMTVIGLCLACCIQIVVGLPAMIYGLAPALHQKISKTQKIAVVQSSLRLSLVGAGLLILPSSIMAYLAAIPAQIYANIKLKKLTEKLTIHGEINTNYKNSLLGSVKRIFPGSLYYALSGQITVLLVSIVGNTHTLAEVGALGRLGQVLTIFSATAGVILVPRFARMEASPWRLSKIYVGILSCIVFLGSLICISAWLFPDAILWVLGSHYSNLGPQLLLQFISASIGLFCGIAYQLGAVRGIIYSPYLAIPTALIYQILGLLVFDFTKVEGVLFFAIGLSCIQAIQIVAYFIGTTLNGRRYVEIAQ